ncbi:MAG: hypothetical protein IT378_07855 [Sandaracinaceae bacterium]|nr:hypothetical protein [Sandaracinaceae bacterium]
MGSIPRVALTVLLAGCYAHHRADSELEVDAAARPLDAGLTAPLDGGRVERPPEPGACLADDYRPARCGDVPAPALRLSFERNLDLTGAWAAGVELTREGRTLFVDGAIGSGARLRRDDIVWLRGTAPRLRDAEQLTLAFWAREPFGPTVAKSFLHCRSFWHGFEIYRGLDSDSATVCVGAGHPIHGPGDCAPYRMCSDARWHHFVLRYDGAAALEVFLDGQLASVADPMEAGAWRLFASATDLALGHIAGAGPAEGTLDLDEVEIWATALSDDQVRSAACTR